MAAGGGILKGLTEVWRERMGDRPPVAHEYMTEHRERWVRFHSLPESKRYATNGVERRTILDRHYTVLDELFGGQDVYIMTSTWSCTAEPKRRSRFDFRVNPGSALWWSFLSRYDPDPDFAARTHVYVAYTTWSVGGLDRLLSAVAEDRTANVTIADRRLLRMYHPYDGGADVLAVDTAERDALRERHADWLSKHPLGM